MRYSTPLVYMIFLVVGIFLARCNNPVSDGTNLISFYKVPLVCGAAPEIGCGSRLKPLFIDTEKESGIKESWSNRQGTVIAIVWNETWDEDLIQSIFEKHSVEADLIDNKSEQRDLLSTFRESRKWYKGMEVDQLSIEEAGFIARDLTSFARDSGLINEQEETTIKKDLEDYFKKELVVVRTNEELGSQETQDRWREDGYQIYVRHIGKERADAVSALYAETFVNTEDCDTEKSDCGKKEDCCKEKEACKK